MEKSDVLQFTREVLDQGPEAALPYNLPDKWLDMLAQDIEILLQEHDSNHSDLSVPLAIVVSILQGKSKQEARDISFSTEELFEHLQFLRFEIALEIVRRRVGTPVVPATIETIFTDRVT